MEEKKLNKEDDRLTLSSLFWFIGWSIKKFLGLLSLRTKILICGKIKMLYKSKSPAASDIKRFSCLMRKKRLPLF